MICASDRRLKPDEERHLQKGRNSSNAQHDPLHATEVLKRKSREIKTNDLNDKGKPLRQTQKANRGQHSACHVYYCNGATDVKYI